MPIMPALRRLRQGDGLSSKTEWAASDMTSKHYLKTIAIGINLKTVKNLKKSVCLIAKLQCTLKLYLLLSIHHIILLIYIQRVSAAINENPISGIIFHIVLTRFLELSCKTQSMTHAFNYIWRFLKVFAHMQDKLINWCYRSRLTISPEKSIVV